MVSLNVDAFRGANLDLFSDVNSRRSGFASSRSRTLTISGRQIKTTPVFEAYWYFAAERQKIFHRRIKGFNQPTLTEDPILSSYRFTNSYRASDRVSQYLIKNVIYSDHASRDSKDIFFRILLFKIFNKIDTWVALEKGMGDLNAVDFDLNRAISILSERKAKGIRNYSAAYIMPSCGKLFETSDKHVGHIKLLMSLMNQDYHKKIAQSESMAECFGILSGVPSFGPFLAYQYATDLNYSSLTDFSEMEFVVAGPGALDGISKCFEDVSDLAPADLIRYMAENQDEYLREVVGKFEDLWGRPLQLIDCQNVFCEISKYSRVAFPEIAGLAGRTRIKQKYQPAGPINAPFYPPKWGINRKIFGS